MNIKLKSILKTNSNTWVYIAEIKDAHIEELKKFLNSHFDIENISNSEYDLKYTNEFEAMITSELKDPSPIFVKYFASKVYQGKLTKKILAQFKELVTASSNQVLNDGIITRLKTDLVKEVNCNDSDVKVTQKPIGDPVTGVVTIPEEIEVFLIIKAILRKTVEIKHIVLRDVQSYFVVLLDDNKSKPICRLYFNALGKKTIGIFGVGRVETKYDLNCLDEIYNYSKELEIAISKYL